MTEVTDKKVVGFVSSKEARRLAGDVSSVTLWRWEKQGRFPKAIHFTKNSKLYRRSELMEWEKNPVAWRAKYEVA